MAEISSLPNGGIIEDTDEVFVTRAGVSYRVQFSASTYLAAAAASAAAAAASAATAATYASGKQTIWVPAEAMRPSTSVGCASLAIVASGTNQPDIASLDFNASTQQYAQFDIALPKNWDEGTVTAQFFWSHASTTTNFGVVWNLQGVAISDGDAIAAAYGTAQQVTDTGGTTDTQYVSSETSAITIAGSPAEGDLVNFRVSRVAADGSDSMAIDARLMGIKLYYTNNAGNDS
jgi:hypothetical protein